MQKTTTNNGTKKARYYYAGYSAYGVDRVSLDSGYYTVHRFESKAERDSWVESHEWDNLRNTWAAKAITRKEAERVLGSFTAPNGVYYSVVIDEVDDNRIIRRKEY